MQALLEFVPLVAFLVAYWWADIYAATAVLMLAMTVLLAARWLQRREIGTVLGASTALVLVFGAATLWLRDERFIQWKPTVFFWALAGGFLASRWLAGPPLAQRLMTPALPDLQVAPAAWQRLNLAWVAFYTAMGALNLAVARLASQSTWVTFKVFGITLLTLVFVVLQAVWLQRLPAANRPVAPEAAP